MTYPDKIKVPFTTVKSIIDRMQFDTYHFPGTNYTVAVAKTPDGFVYATGESSCIDPDSFDEKLGRDAALADVKKKMESKIWELEAYVLLEDVRAKHRARQQDILEAPQDEPVEETITAVKDFELVRQNVDRFGAPLVGQRHEIARNNQRAYEREVFPWFHASNAAAFYAPAKRKIEGGVTAPLATRTRATPGPLQLSNAFNTGKSLIPGPIEKLWVQVGASFFAVEATPGHWFYRDDKLILSFRFEMQVDSTTEFQDRATGWAAPLQLGQSYITATMCVDGEFDTKTGEFLVAAEMRGLDLRRVNPDLNGHAAIEKLYSQMMDAEVVGVDLGFRIQENVVEAPLSPSPKANPLSAVVPVGKVANLLAAGDGLAATVSAGTLRVWVSRLQVTYATGKEQWIDLGEYDSVRAFSPTAQDNHAMWSLDFTTGLTIDFAIAPPTASMAPLSGKLNTRTGEVAIYCSRNDQTRAYYQVTECEIRIDFEGNP